MKKQLFTFILWVYAISLQSQVINIESKRFLNDTNGWVGRADVNFSVIQNIQQFLSLGNTVHIQYQHNKSRFLFLNDINLIKAGSNDLVNSGFQHLRYNYKINTFLTAEVFTQAQYNRILRLNLRYLAGAGPRLKLFKKPDFRMYVACLYMYEYEEITNDPVINRDNRLSSYLSFTLGLGKIVELTSTTFYQPNMADLNDYRIANDSALEITIGKHLNYRTGFNLLYDTKQPEGIPNLVYSLKNGLSYKF
ncbi:MAG: DUF481 domain-containing protein [Bacteroidia bacterium]